jgi:D-xylose transport system substrate-binding protein
MEETSFMSSTFVRFAAAASAIMLLAACSAAPGASGTASGAASGGKVALLLPEKQTARYEAADRPLFEAKFKSECPNTELIYNNAGGDDAAQLNQAESAMTNGATVLVLDPNDADAAGKIVTEAGTKGVKVISYDRLIKGNAKPDYYVEFDSNSVGKLQGQALLDKLTAMGKTNAKVLWINGSPKDNNAKLFAEGAHSVLDGKVDIVKEDAAANWKPEEAQQLMEQFIAAVGKDGFDGAYCANDGTAGGAIAAMKAAGIDPKTRPITGQDAEVAAVQRILSGEQYMTVYKAIQPEAEKTAELACGLFKGEKPAADAKVNNGTIDVPSVLLTPIAVTASGGGTTKSVAETIVKDKFYGPDTAAKICKGYEPACQTANIK